MQHGIRKPGITYQDKKISLSFVGDCISLQTASIQVITIQRPCLFRDLPIITLVTQFFRARALIIILCNNR